MEKQCLSGSEKFPFVGNYEVIKRPFWQINDSIELSKTYWEKCANIVLLKLYCCKNMLMCDVEMGINVKYYFLHNRILAISPSYSY